ncbi:MAG: putative secreted protein [Marmoricola sp.]|nr:putative secreted protein [Marmoricola sp.]
MKQMSRATKGALAASAAGVLLLGGAGSLAYWNDSKTVTGGSISSGTLSLTQESGQVCSGWTLDAAGGPTAYTPGVTLVVPGDVITKSCDYTVHATGAHLAADLTMDATSITGSNALAAALTPNATYTLGGSPAASGADVTSANDGDVLNAAITVTFSSATTGLTAQGMTAGLDNIVVSLTQTHP